jgi:hypothetical protein
VTGRECAECNKKDTEVVLFRITLPDTVDGYYCREHILIEVDNSKSKTKSKAKQQTRS